jgi:hypothetical protein
MRLERAVTSADPEEAVASRARRFLESRGYRPDGDGFRRGSLWGSWFSVTPRKWGAHATVLGEGDGRYGIKIDVSVSGRVAMLSELKFWNEELAAIAAAIEGTAAPVDGLSNTDAVVQRSNWRTINLAAAYSGVFGLVCGAIQVLADPMATMLPEWFVGVGIVAGGVLALLQRRVEDGRRAAGKPPPPGSH